MWRETMTSPERMAAPVKGERTAVLGSIVGESSLASSGSAPEAVTWSVGRTNSDGRTRWPRVRLSRNPAWTSLSCATPLRWSGWSSFQGPHASAVSEMGSRRLTADVSRLAARCLDPEVRRHVVGELHPRPSRERVRSMRFQSSPHRPLCCLGVCPRSPSQGLPGICAASTVRSHSSTPGRTLRPKPGTSDGRSCRIPSWTTTYGPLPSGRDSASPPTLRAAQPSSSPFRSALRPLLREPPRDCGSACIAPLSTVQKRLRYGRLWLPRGRAWL